MLNVPICEGCGLIVPGSSAMMENHKKNECEKNWENEQQTPVPKSVQEEKKIILRILKNDKKARGNTYYVISFKWFQIWKDYVGYSEDGKNSTSGRKPSRIDNSNLIKEGDGTFQELKQNLQLGYDYEIVPRSVWVKFKTWYGGGPEIPKKVLGIWSTLLVDLYPINVIVKVRQAPTFHREYSFNRFQKIIEIKYHITNELYIRPHHCGVYLLNDKGEEVKIEPEQKNMTLEDLNIPSGTTIIISKDLEDTSIQLTGRPMSFNYSFNSWVPKNEKGNPLQLGICGYHNLGNTCFMNSALQCLCQTPPLVSYFLKKSYLNDLNTNTTTKGNFCIEFDHLLRKMWSGNFTALVPTTFRSTLLKIAPQFAGHNQHDSQELLYFVLEGLHEELTGKPSNPEKKSEKQVIPTTTGNSSNSEKSDGTSETQEIPTATQPNDNTPDNKEGKEKEITPEKDLKLEKNSKIMNIFKGVHNSTVTCLQCHKTSTTRENFFSLSLPVPSKDYRRVELYFFPINGTPKKYAAQVPKSGNIMDLKISLATLTDLSASKLLFFEFYSHQMFELPDNKRLFDVRSNDTILVHEIELSSVPLIQVRVFNRRLSHSAQWDLFGYPFLISFEEGTTNNKIHEMIFSKLQHYIKIEKANYGLFVSYYNGTDHGKSLPKDENRFGYEEGIVFTIDWEPEEVNYVIKFKDNIILHESAKTQDEELDVHLDTCLGLYTAEEDLSDANYWYCSNCKTKAPSRKQLSLSTLPSHLVLHLKRFQYTTIYRDKITSAVHYPLTDLDMAPFLGVAEPVLYDLYAVSNHLGGMSGGHYTAVVKSKNDQKWYKLDDARASPVDSADVVTPHAYLLFYRKKDSPPEDWSDIVLDDDEEDDNNCKKKPELPEKSEESKSEKSKSKKSKSRTDKFKISEKPEIGLKRKTSSGSERRLRGDDGRECSQNEDDEPEEREFKLPELPIPGQHRHGHHEGPDGPNTGNALLRRSGFFCQICGHELYGFEEFQMHILTEHYDDPVAMSMVS